MSTDRNTRFCDDAIILRYINYLKSYPIIARKDIFAEVVTRRFYIRLLCSILRDISRRRKRIVPRKFAR